MQTQSTTIEITPTSRPGVFEFRPPFKNDGFLNEFRRKIGKPYRSWNVFRETWQVRPLDAGHLKLMADLLEKHFSRPVMITEPADPEPPAKLEEAPCSCCNSYPEEALMLNESSSINQTFTPDARLVTPGGDTFEMISDRFRESGLPEGALFRVRRIEGSPFIEGIACSTLELAVVKIDGSYYLGHFLQDSAGSRELISTRRRIDLTSSSFQIVGINIRVTYRPVESEEAVAR
ncbi:MAG: hypothetical protein IPM66_21590 [Acidobacteriota bacterium]|nr:MAG: hypothetical protein IPM66_21590 [Acidobacteriota bacterium]